ncbi:MAG: hypothetical protein WKH64_06705 [Chloroflexia bacterium]
MWFVFGVQSSASVSRTRERFGPVAAVGEAATPFCGVALVTLVGSAVGSAGRGGEEVCARLVRRRRLAARRSVRRPRRA